MPLGPETSATDDSGLYGSSGDVDGDMSVVTSGTDPIPASDSGTDVESCVDSQDNNVAGEADDKLLCIRPYPCRDFPSISWFGFRGTSTSSMVGCLLVQVI